MWKDVQKVANKLKLGGAGSILKENMLHLKCQLPVKAGHNKKIELFPERAKMLMASKLK